MARTTLSTLRSNSDYGVMGPWALESYDGRPMTFEETRAQFVAAMAPTFREWALDKLEVVLVGGAGIDDEKVWVADKIEEMGKEFYDALHLYPDAEWLAAHRCPECGTRAPECYDDEEHPSWDCSTCLAAKSEEV